MGCENLVEHQENISWLTNFLILLTWLLDNVLTFRGEYSIDHYKKVNLKAFETAQDMKFSSDIWFFL